MIDFENYVLGDYQFSFAHYGYKETLTTVMF